MTRAEVEEVEVNQQGRVTIPAQLRGELGLTPGTKMVAYDDEDGRLVLEPRHRILTRLQDQIAADSARQGHTGSVVDELITDRRAEAAAEAEQ